MHTRTSSTSLVLCCAVLVVVGGVAPAAVSGVSEPQSAAVNGSGTATPQVAPGITSVSTDGPGHVTNATQGFVYWNDEPFRINVTVTPPNGTVFYVCVQTNSSDRGPGCRTFSPRNATHVEYSFDVDGWQTDSSWRSALNVTLRTENSTLDQREVSVSVLTREGDVDTDGLTNQREANMSTSMFESDTDGDGISDGTELNSHDTDPALADTDDDGVPDGAEINRGTDPTDPDSDEDGLTDGAELSNSTDPLKPDTDDDGLDDGREVALGSDPLSPNTDDDGIDDRKEVALGLDPTKQDTDGDMLDDDTERALGTNPKSAWTPLFLGGGGITLLFVIGVVLRRSEWSSGTVLDDGDTQFTLPDWVSNYVRDHEPDEPRAVSAESESAVATDREAIEEESTDDSSPDDRIWTDRDEVLALVQEHDGRLKQRDVVENTDWSESKVSRTLSAMEEDNQISRLEIGREKIVTLYDEEPDVFSSDRD
ncbi:hypothetical protein [Haloarchaeobius sp. FL176]|uniref:helix-turn-helix transcriptional regulator n=1 Tax=Haloarchaeobius sp. FL176 TaxID=2967129 RepID=UPI0021476DBE|nr:hypothetical protein [Haloarchaeobius sp. FL176]